MNYKEKIIKIAGQKSWDILKKPVNLCKYEKIIHVTDDKTILKRRKKIQEIVPNLRIINPLEEKVLLSMRSKEKRIFLKKLDLVSK